MAAVNFTKHLRILVNRRDRLAREIRAKQHEHDVVSRRLAGIQTVLATVDPKPLADVLTPDAWKPFIAEKGGAA